MSLVAMPFYQKRHKNFDQSYRNIQTRYLLDEYAAKKRASTQTSSQKSVTQKSSSQRGSSQTAQEGTTCRLCARKVSTALEEDEQERRHSSSRQGNDWGWIFCILVQKRTLQSRGPTATVHTSQLDWPQASLLSPQTHSLSPESTLVTFGGLET
ncbi:hypothetical protein J1605_016162 [Eschrichtius robustus]|uniref:Uncharacterized protein n=1 Tax=Eschrichtius robustus TaxID=9764 RepID=A0AB34G8D3_ESCRO|nr:hypothetical protein J1605_016162 [Eschrichtius robustus]